MLATRLHEPPPAPTRIAAARGQSRAWDWVQIQFGEWRMSAFAIVGIAWLALTLILILLLIYRSTLVMHEDDQLFLNDSESHMAKEQNEVLSKLQKVQPWVRVFTGLSGLLALVLVGMWVYDIYSKF
jgi:hypothetical protein